MKFKASIKPWTSFEKKVHRVIQFNQKAQVKPYIDIDTEQKEKQKINLKETFLITQFLKKNGY